MTRLLMAAAVLLVTGTAGAQCCGDCNADGAVTIDEILQGVSVALGSEMCVAPAQCAETFRSTIEDGAECLFTGLISSGCASRPFVATFLTDNEGFSFPDLTTVDIIIVGGNETFLDFYGDTISGHTTALVYWAVTGSDSLIDLEGGALLERSGERLIVEPNSTLPPGASLDGCQFQVFIGEYTGVLGTAGAAGAAGIGDDTINRLRMRVAARRARTALR